MLDYLSFGIVCHSPKLLNLNYRIPYLDSFNVEVIRLSLNLTNTCLKTTLRILFSNA